MAGCNHHCKGCHNPNTWDINGGKPYDYVAHWQLLYYLSKSWVSGLTLTGGDPLHPLNRAEVECICKDVKGVYPDKTIWLYTGYTWPEISNIDWIKAYVDVVIDGQYIESLKDLSLPWRGSSNQNIIDISKMR